MPCPDLAAIRREHHRFRAEGVTASVVRCFVVGTGCAQGSGRRDGSHRLGDDEGRTRVNQLRFEAGLGHYSVSVATDSVWIFKGMGTHYFQVQLQVGIPEVAAVAGRLLCLETTLYAPEGSGPKVPLASVNVSVPFIPEGDVRQPTLQYLITNALWVPKTCATWANALRNAVGSVKRSASARPEVG
jgi:hypothetical protein